MNFEKPNLGSTSRKTMTLGSPKPQMSAESQKLSKNRSKFFIRKTGINNEIENLNF